MLKNYAVFPCRNIRITQDYYGNSHKTQPNSTNGVKSYPLDIAFSGLKLTAFADKVKSIKMNGFYNESVLNQVFFQSVDKVYMANGDYDYITMLAGHSDDWDYTQNQIGTIYDRYQEMLDMGYDEVTIDNTHLDIVVAKGKQNGWVLNSFGEYVLPNSMKFEDVFYIDPKFNNIIDTKGINFKTIPTDAYITIPTPVKENKDVDQVKVICDINTLNVRESASTDGVWIGQATPGFYNVISTAKDDKYTWYQVEEGKWFANAEGCTEFIKKYVAPVIIEPDPIIKEPVEEQPIDNGPKEPQEQPIEDGQTNTPTDTETTDSGTNNEEKKHNIIVSFIIMFFKLISEILKGGK